MVALVAQSSYVAVGQTAGGKESAAERPQTPLTRQLQQNQALQSVVAKQAALVSEFDVNGLKVLVKRREGSLTVAAGLFIRGGSRNITAENAGIEALMLDVASEASVTFPRERLRSDLSRMGTIIGFDVNRDYSVLALRCTRPNFDRSWQIFSKICGTITTRSWRLPGC